MRNIAFWCPREGEDATIMELHLPDPSRSTMAARRRAEGKGRRCSAVCGAGVELWSGGLRRTDCAAVGR